MPKTSVPSSDQVIVLISGWSCGGLDSAAFMKLPVWTRLCLAASDLLGWHYAHPNGQYADSNHFPAARGAIPAQLVKSGVARLAIDCSSQTSYLTMTVYPYANWTFSDYADLQIQDGNRPWSPMDVLPRHGVGTVLAQPEDAQPGDVVLSQAWVDASLADGTPLSGGHARYVRILPDGSLEVLESTNRSDAHYPAGYGPTRTYTTLVALKVKYTDGVRFCRLL